MHHSHNFRWTIPSHHDNHVSLFYTLNLLIACPSALHQTRPPIPPLHEPVHRRAFPIIHCIEITCAHVRLRAGQTIHICFPAILKYLLLRKCARELPVAPVLAFGKVNCHHQLLMTPRDPHERPTLFRRPRQQVQVSHLRKHRFITTHTRAAHICCLRVNPNLNRDTKLEHTALPQAPQRFHKTVNLPHSARQLSINLLARPIVDHPPLLVARHERPIC